MILRALVALLLLAAPLPAALYQCIDFPYASFPRELWQRELVWMKNIGIRNIAISVPDGGKEEDVLAILRDLRRLGMTVWVRSAKPSPDLNAWIAPQMQSHGGPVAYFGEQAAPQPVTRVSALSPKSLALSRDALAVPHGTLVWTDVESTVTPEFHKGAISFSGDEQPTTSQLRRDAALLDYWSAGIGQLKERRPVRDLAGKLPEGVTAAQLIGPASAVSIVNHRAQPWSGQVRVFYPPAKHSIILPTLRIAAGDALWLPVNVPLAKGPFCKNCDALGNGDSLVYATAELTGIEYENGILAMEFNAPMEGEVVLHLAQEPSGPLLAAGTPRQFEWDSGTGRVKLPVPAGRGASSRVRIGLALEPPDSSAFFGDTKVLIIGQKNRVTTSYSSEQVAQRSRLRAPEWLKASPTVISPLEIAYDLTVPPTVLHGEHIELALEADGVQMGHTRLQFLRPASMRIRGAASRHFGNIADLPVTPALLPLDDRQGGEVNVTIRNNFPEIRTYALQVIGEGIDFLPLKTEITIAASSERDVSLRVFPQEGKSGMQHATLRLTGPVSLEVPADFLVIPRNSTVAYRTEYGYVLESQKVRAVFSSEKAERWLEFVWKDSERNLLPAAGISLGPGTHTVSLKDATLILDQPDLLKPGRQGDVTVQVQHNAYTLLRQ